MTDRVRRAFIILLVMPFLAACATLREPMSESGCEQMLHRGSSGNGDRYQSAYRLLERKRYQDAIDWLWCCTITGHEKAEAYYHLARIIAIMASDTRMRKEGLEYAYLPCNQGFESSMMLFLKIAIYLDPSLRTRLAFDEAFSGVRTSDHKETFARIADGPKWNESRTFDYPACLRIHVTYSRTVLIYATDYRVLEIVDSDARHTKKNGYWETCATLKVGPDELYYDIFMMGPGGSMYSPGQLAIERKKK